MNRTEAINKTRNLMSDLAAHLEEHPMTMDSTLIYQLANAIHGAMCVADWPELNWMDITFEDVASSLVNAEKCVTSSDEEKEHDMKKYGRVFTDDDADRLRELRENGGL